MTQTGHHRKPDFFERLIDRTLGVDGGITPRLRSLFEPAGQTAGPNSLEQPQPDAIGDAATERHSQEALPLTPPPRKMQPDRGPAQDITVRPTEDEPAPIVPSPRTVFVDASIVAETSPPAIPLAAAPLVAPDAGDPVYAPHRDGNASPPAAAHARISVPITVVRRRDPSSPGERDASDARVPPQLVPDARVTIERDFATPSRVAHRREPDDRYVGQAAEPAAPSVNITIGRVEVRAISAPAPRPRAEPRGPQPLGLDEYLKRRGAR
jgi:hypothetical protein